MKRVVSVLLLVCMLVSLMGMGTAAYAEELADGAAVVEQTGDVPVSNPEQTGGDAEQENPTTPEPPQPTEAPLTEGDGQGTTQESEATPTPEVTARPAADEGFFAALTDAELSALTAELARLGYNVTDRAGLYALAVQLGIDDLENFYIWLDNELYILESAKVEANGKLYESLDEVVALLANDSARAVTAKLLDNAAVYGLEVPAAHELTLDLNGFALVLEMQEGETAPAPVTVADRMEKDENGDPVYSYAALTLKNGIVSAGDPNALAIYDAGRLALANVNVVGGIHVAESYERLTMLSIEPGDAFKTGFVNGAITADAGMDNAIRITGGDFITDVSAYIDASVYECTLGDNGLYTVARIKGADITSYTGDDAADAANGAVVKVPSLKITAEPNAELDTAADAALDNASVKLAGLESALKETSLAEIIAAYEAAAPAQTQQARGMSRAVVIAAGDENADNAGNAADTSAVADGTELQLKVKAVLAAAVEGSSVSYEVKPYAVINGVEVPVKNEWLNGQAMLLSLYTGFLPKTVEHVHDDGTVETIDLNNCTYNNANGVLTMNVSEFSETAVYFKERFSLKESLEEIKKIWNNMAIDKYKNEVKLKKGVMPVLELLRDKGYKTGIATSNSMELALACIEANGIKKYFDAIVTGCDVGAGKPAPDIYLKNAKICNVLPKESLVFEDVVQGIEAGHNAGMRVCAVFDEYSVYIDEEKHRKADYYINDFNEVIKELRKAEI